MGASGELTKLGCESVVIDSAPEIQRVIRDQVLRERGQDRNPGYVFTQADWGVLTERTRRFMRTVRDLPAHVLVLTLTNKEKDEKEVISFSPSFEGRKLPGEVAQFFTAVGDAFKREVGVEGQKEPDTEHLVLFQGATRFGVKPCEPLARIERPDATDWIRRIVAHEPTKAPASDPATPTDAPATAAPATTAPAVAASTPETKPAQAAPANGASPTVTTTTTRRSRAARQEVDPTN